MTPDILTAVVVAILSSKLWDFLAARFKRKDEREDKEDKVLQAIRDLKAEVGTISTKVDENAAVLARTHILRFNDELINNIEHSQEYFRQQLQDIDTYEAYCDAVIIRLGYRGCTSGKIVYDDMFKTFLDACKKYGIPYSIYFFPTSVNDTEQAQDALYIIEFENNNAPQYVVEKLLVCGSRGSGLDGYSGCLIIRRDNGVNMRYGVSFGTAYGASRRTCEASIGTVIKVYKLRYAF